MLLANQSNQSFESALRAVRLHWIFVGLISMSATLPAHAQSTDTGYIVVMRQVEPRNALVPGEGPAQIVRTAPETAIFGLFSGSVRMIDDNSAAQIIGRSSVMSDINGRIQPGFGALLGSHSGALTGAAERGSGNGTGIGATVGGAIGTAMDSLGGALGAIRAGGPGQ